MTKPKTKAKTALKPVAKTKTKAAPKKVSKPVVKAKAPVKKAQVEPVKKVALKPAVKKPLASQPVAAKPAAVAKPAIVPKPVVAAVKPVVAAVKPVVVAPVAKPAVVVAAAPAAPRKHAFKPGELVAYPAHGVGRVVNVEEQEIAGTVLELYIVDFEKDKLRLKVPTNRAEQKGMRRLSDRTQIEQALRVLRGRARIKRTMWSRRAQEYDAKINSGDLMSVAEVVRDLYRSERQPEQSYSERQLFEQALERLAREIAAVRKIDDDQSIRELGEYLSKNAKRAAAAGDAKAEAAIPAEEAA